MPRLSGGTLRLEGLADDVPFLTSSRLYVVFKHHWKVTEKLKQLSKTILRASQVSTKMGFSDVRDLLHPLACAPGDFGDKPFESNRQKGSRWCLFWKGR